MTTLSAQSVTDSGIFGTAEDQTRVQQVVGVNLSPSRYLPILPGTVMKFPHVLINTGNGKDTFALTATLKSGSTIAWPVAIQPITITLEPGASYQQIEVSVTVPPNIQPPLPTEIIVTAASQRNPAVRSQVTDMIGGIGQIEPRRFALFFPNVVHQQPTPTSSPMPTSTTVPGKGSVPTDTAMPTDTAVPTGTPMPTSTPVPTNVTEPTNSPTTGAPTEPPTGRATATPEP
jgi:hypothetical protein